MTLPNEDKQHLRQCLLCSAPSVYIYDAWADHGGWDEGMVLVGLCEEHAQCSEDVDEDAWDEELRKRGIECIYWDIEELASRKLREK